MTFAFVFTCVDKQENGTALSVYGEEGQEVQMSCRPNGNTANEDVRWWKESDRLVVNGVVLPVFNDRMSFDTTTGILAIHDVQIWDSGVYYCSVGAIGYETTFKVQLTVSGKPQFSGNSCVNGLLVQGNLLFHL